MWNDGEGGGPLENTGQETYVQPKRKKATAELVAKATTRAPRIIEYEISEELGWCAIATINDREYTAITNSAINSKGKYDKAQGALVNVRLIAAMSRDLDDHSKKMFAGTDQDFRYLRGLEAGEIDRWANACREHLGIMNEDELKNSSKATQEND